MKSKRLYPEKKQESLVETLHGVQVEDPYRWLEENSSEVLQWQDGQNALTAQCGNSICGLQNRDETRVEFLRRLYGNRC